MSRTIFYKHVQNRPYTTWNVVHELGTNPVVNVFVNINNILTEIVPLAVTYVDKNTLTVTFDATYTGVVHCISRASAIPEKSTTTVSEYTTISNNLILNIAILDSFYNTSLDITLSFRKETSRGVGEFIPITYNISTTSSNISSSWAESNTVIYNNKKYQVRAISLINDEFLKQKISDLTLFYVSDINSTSADELKRNNVLFLLSNSPYQPIDKILNKIIDSVDLNNSDLKNNFKINNENVDVTTSTIQTIYPNLF